MEAHLDKIRRLESSGGKNDKCVREGKGWNGYGFGQSLTKFNCYASHEEVRSKVRAWFKARIPAMGLAQANCYYNTGHKVSKCPYNDKYNSL